MVREVEDPSLGMPVLQAGCVPHVLESPGEVRWTGPAIGAHTEDVLSHLLGLSEAEIQKLRMEGVI